MKDKKVMIAIALILLIAGFAVYNEQNRNAPVEPITESQPVAP